MRDSQATFKGAQKGNKRIMESQGKAHEEEKERAENKTVGRQTTKAETVLDKLFSLQN